MRRPADVARDAWRRGRAALAALTAFAPALPASAAAASCSPEVAAQIRFSAGHACWTYRGRATLFVGDFSTGATVSAQMIGEATEYNPRSGRARTVSRPRDPNVEGPGGFYFGDAQAPGLLTFVVPATGTYRFSFAPCAMWGAPGAVRICAG